jgi:hypothetical protein
MQQDFNYGGFDPETAFKLRVGEAAEFQRKGVARAIEAATLFEAALKGSGSLDDPFSLTRAYRASGDGSWVRAPREEYDSGILARAYGVRPRSPGNSFFVDATLCGKRTLQAAAGVGANLVGDRSTHIGEQAGSNSFLPLCTVLGPAVLASFYCIKSIT